MGHIQVILTQQLDDDGHVAGQVDVDGNWDDASIAEMDPADVEKMFVMLLPRFARAALDVYMTKTDEMAIERQKAESDGA